MSTRAYVVRFLGLSLNTPLKLDRVGIRVRPKDARQYEVLIAAIRAKPSNLRFYAGPDSPEVYFLAARPYLTRFFFDFREYDPRGLLHVLEEKQIDLVALNRTPHFSAIPSPVQSGALQRRYPQLGYDRSVRLDVAVKATLRAPAEPACRGLAARGPPV